MTSNAVRQTRLGGALPVALALLAAGPAHAEPPADPLTLGLTVSGGVSLGSYEAGYLYYLTLLFKLNPGAIDPRIFTGASAGSVNAMLALMASCSPPDFRASDNLFFNAWVPVGLDSLFKAKQARPTAAFSGEAGARTLARVGKVWAQGLDAACDATLGMSVTRVTAVPVEVTEQVKVPRTEAKFVVRVRGQGPGKPPRLTNYVSGENELSRPLLPEEADGTVSFESLGQALEASTAFPLAFAPRPVTHCPSRRGEVPRCPRSAAITSLFYDGGVFDNQPLRLAVQLAARGLLPGQLPRFRPTPDDRQRAVPARSTFLYLDPDTEVLPELSDLDPPPLDRTLPYALYLLSQLVGSARSAELQALLDETPEVKQQLDATLTYFRPLSGVLLNFFGFFDTEVRAHDFFLGMHDAAQFAAGWPKALSGGGGGPLVLPEQALAAQGPEARASWGPFLCMRAVFDGVGDPGACQGQNRNFLAGAQTTVDKLFARCEQALTRATARGLPGPATTHPSCQAAMAGHAPPQVPGVARQDGWRFREGESPFDHQLRRMQEHGYAFNDLGLEAGQSPRRAMARQMNLVSTAVGRQDLLVASAGRSYAQSIEYVPPDHAITVLLGQAVEVGYSYTDGNARGNWARFHASLGVEGLLSWLGPAPGRYLNLAPEVGVEFEAVPLSGAVFQWRGGVRAGFQFSSGDRFAAVACTQALPCSRVVTEVYLAGVVVQWARLQLGVELLPPMRGLPFDARFKPSLGVEIDWP